MNTRYRLSPKPVWNLATTDIRTHIKTISLQIAGFFGIILVVRLLSGIDGSVDAAHEAFYGIGTLVGGLAIVTLFFKDIHEAPSAFTHLTLPVSSLERHISRLLLTTVVWFAVATVLYSLYSLVDTLAFAVILPRAEVSPYIPSGRTLLDLLGFYLSAQSVFFFGAIYFRKHTFWKTVLSAFAVGIFFALCAAISLRLVFADQFQSFFTLNVESSEIMLAIEDDPAAQQKLASFTNVVRRVSQVLYYAVVPIFFWAVGLLRLSETEA